MLGSGRGRQLTRIQFNILLKKFLVFLKKELKIQYDIPVILVDDINFAKKIASFGETSSENVIRLSIINRHPMDIFRTLAHEFVHYKQHIEKGPRRSSRSGSFTENQANAKAGELMRKYGNLHPELFLLAPIK